jgi:integrase
MFAKRNLGRKICSSRLTLDQDLDYWLDFWARPRLHTKSFRDYSTVLARYVRSRLGAGPLGEPSPTGILAPCSELLNRKMSARKNGCTHAFLFLTLRQSVLGKLLLTNHAEDVDLPRQPRRRFIAFNVEQAKQFFAAISEYNYEALLAIAITAGMRWSEHLAPTWSDFDLNHGTVTLPNDRRMAERRMAFRRHENRTPPAPGQASELVDVSPWQIGGRDQSS